jgi:hypothetical protein
LQIEGALGHALADRPERLPVGAVHDEPHRIVLECGHHLDVVAQRQHAVALGDAVAVAVVHDHALDHPAPVEAIVPHEGRGGIAAAALPAALAAAPPTRRRALVAARGLERHAQRHHLADQLPGVLTDEAGLVDLAGVAVDDELLVRDQVDADAAGALAAGDGAGPLAGLRHGPQRTAVGRRLVDRQGDDRGLGLEPHDAVIAGVRGRLHHLNLLVGPAGEPRALGALVALPPDLERAELGQPLVEQVKRLGFAVVLDGPHVSAVIGGLLGGFLVALALRVEVDRLVAAEENPRQLGKELVDRVLDFRHDDGRTFVDLAAVGTAHVGHEVGGVEVDLTGTIAPGLGDGRDDLVVGEAAGAADQRLDDVLEVVVGARVVVRCRLVLQDVGGVGHAGLRCARAGAARPVSR